MKRTNIILTIIVLILLIILFFLASFTYENIEKFSSSESFVKSISKFVENNSTPIFTIDKITYFSSSDANISTNNNSAFTISNLYQYTDIAIFINTNQKEFTAENTLKKVELKDISYSLSPTIGTPNLYFKSISDFATPKFDENNIIHNSIIYEATSEDEIDYSTPVLYNNCANPITLCYVNSNIKKDYTLFDNISDISHNGSLLKSCGITLNSISCKIDLTVEIENNLNDIYYCPLSIDIPLSTENSTIYDGTLTVREQKIGQRLLKK